MTTTVGSLDELITVTIEDGVGIELTVENLDISVTGAVISVNGEDGEVVLTQDDIGDGTTYAQYSATEKTKLSGIEPGAEVNNISDLNATDLTDGGATTLHKHSYTDLDNKPTIPDELSDLTGDSTHRTVTDTEKNTWNAKSDLALGNLSTNAYPGDKGKTAYDHSQVAHAPADAEKNVQPDWNQADSGADDYIKNKPGVGTGDVVGPSGATADNIPIFNGATGKLIKDSAKQLSDYSETSHNHALNNLTEKSYSNLTDKPTLGNSASKDVGTTAGTVCAGDDSRLTDNRTDANAIHKTTAAEISAMTDKATPVDADLVVIEDSETTPTAYGKKKLTWANIKSVLKTYFDGLYLALSGGTMTGDIQLGETDIKLDAVLSADEKWSGIVITGNAGSSMAQGNVIFLASDGKWDIVDGILDGTDTGFSKQLGITLTTANDTDPIEILVYGKVRSAKFPALTIGSAVYLSDTAGELVVAQPSTDNFCIRVVGFAITAEDLLFNPSNDYIIYNA